MTDKPAASADVAVLHPAGGAGLRALLGRLPQPASFVGGPGRPSVTAWREFPREQAGTLARWLSEHGVGTVITVLPASSVFCRTVPLPDADPDSLRAALALQAEAQLPDHIPPHRRAAAVMPAAPGETGRAGLIVAWPESAGAEDDAIGGIDDRLRATSAPDVAALAALLNGQRPAEPVFFFDRRRGSVALAIAHPNGVAFRAARAAPDSGAEGVVRLVAETALSVGHTPQSTEALGRAAGARLAEIDADCGLAAPPEIAAAAAGRLEGAPADSAWWRDYGAAAGALMAAAGDLAPLTELRRSAPAETPPLHRRIAERLSQPAVAARVVLASVLVVMLAPLAAAGARLGLLELQLPDLQKHVRAAEEADARLAVYRELDDHAWPMSKLLADVACNTPEAIDLEQIRLRHGEPLRVSGRAKPDREAGLSAQEVVTRMHENLRRTGIFDDIYLQWGDPNNFGHYEFMLSASVTAPYRRHDYPRELDYGAWPLRERLYGTPEAELISEIEDAMADAEQDDAEADAAATEEGEDGAETPAARGGRQGAADESPRISRRGDLPDFGRGDSDDGAIGRGTARPVDGGALPRSMDVPDPLTDEQIQAMDFEELKQALAHVSQALQQARLDEETEARLRDDFGRVRDRWRELRDEQRRGGGDGS